LHIALRGHDDDQKTALGQAQEFDVPEHGRTLGRHDHPDKLRQVRQELGRVGNDLLRLVGLQTGCLKLFALGREHGVDKQAVATGRRNPASRSVRAGNQPQIFQIRHDVPDGGWRQLQAGSLGQGSGAHGLTVGDVALHQGFEQQLGTIVEHQAILMM
jgi:hypothetical protein